MGGQRIKVGRNDEERLPDNEANEVQGDPARGAPSARGSPTCPVGAKGKLGTMKHKEAASAFRDSGAVSDDKLELVEV